MSSAIIANGDTDTVYIAYVEGSYYYGINGTPNILFFFPAAIINISSSGNILPILFSTDIPIYDTNTYFVVGSNNLQFGSTNLNNDGSRYNISINNVSNYPGFIQNGTSSTDGYGYVSIYNLNIQSVSSTLSDGSGWVGQSYFGKNSINNEIENCTTNGDIPQNGGGILGSYSCSGGAVTTLVVRCCSSTGAIGLYAGGIVGQLSGSFGSSNLTIERCWSSGDMTGQGGGMTGNSCGISGGTVICDYCYSTGEITNSSGGIYGVTNGSGGTINAYNCYSNGNISGSSGGIFGGNAGQSGGTATANNCYSSGTIDSTSGGIFGNGYATVSALACYTSGTMSVPNGGIFAGSSTIPSGCYAEGVNANVGWNNTNAAATLFGPPSGSMYGSIWCQPNGINTPYVLTLSGYSPYSLSLTITANASIMPGQSTPAAVVPSYTYSILATNGVPPTDSITIDASTGIITAAESVTAGTYTIIVYSSMNPYSITTYTLIITSPPAPAITVNIPTMCCMPDNKMNGLSYPTINNLTIGNNVSRDIARCTPHLPLPSYSFYYSFVAKNNFNK